MIFLSNIDDKWLTCQNTTDDWLVRNRRWMVDLSEEGDGEINFGTIEIRWAIPE